MKIDRTEHNKIYSVEYIVDIIRGKIQATLELFCFSTEKKSAPYKIRYITYTDY